MTCRTVDPCECRANDVESHLVAVKCQHNLEACTLSPDPPDAAALEPFLMLMVIHPHQVPDALFMFLGPVGWQLRLYPPEQMSDGVETVHDLDSLADALGLVAVTILSSKSLLAEAKRQGFCPPRGYNRRRGDRA